MRRLSFRTVLLLGAVTLLSNGPLFAQSEKDSPRTERPSFPTGVYNDEGAPTGIPFELLHGFLIAIEGRIGPLSHLKFILDTGVTRTVLDRKVAERLHLVCQPRKVLNYNRSVAVEWATIPDVEFGPTKLANVPILVADIADFSELANRDVDALIGYDLLRLSNFVFDYDARMVIFTPFKQPASAGSTKKAADQLTVLTLAVQVQGHPLHLIVDTGLQGMVLFEDRVLKRLPDLRFEIDTESVEFGRHLRARTGTLPKVHLGRADRDLRVLLLQGPPNDQVPDIDGYFGTALLKARWIEFNAAENHIGYK
jgi:predicted aspartyl protease